MMRWYWGALAILQQVGLCVPEDVALVGFDDMEEARYGTLPPTTVRQRVFEQGFVAARLGESILIADTQQVTEWLSNPLLVQTRAELAAPIKLGTAVLGVLDVQSNVAGGLTAEDQLPLVGLCGQIAVAINYRRAEVVLQESEARFSRVFHASLVAISLRGKVS